MSRPLRVSFFEVPPWKWDIAVCHGGTHEQFCQWVNQTLDEDLAPEPSVQGYCFASMGKPICVWVHDLADVPTLVHELMHLVFKMLAMRGVSYSHDSEEVFTYTVEMLLRGVTAHRKWERA